MRKLLSCAFIALLVLTTACKKAEEPKRESKEPSQTAAKKKVKNRKGAKGAFLEIYNEKKPVTSMTLDEFRTMATSKIKVGESEFNAVQLKDLLSKNQLQGKFVILSSGSKSAALTWEQAAKPVYLYTAVKPFLLVNTTAKELANIKFPAKISRITVSLSAEPPAPEGAKRAKKRKRR